VLLEKTPFAQLDRHAASYVEKAMARAAYTFALVRGLNGMISAIHGGYRSSDGRVHSSDCYYPTNHPVGPYKAHDDSPFSLS
jgi:hypothetical protein